VRYHVFACDYDGTLASHGRVDAPTLDALDRVRASGRKLILVTGRQLPDLMEVFPRLDLFDRVVAENGAVLYWPSDRTERTLAEPPPPAFVTALEQRNVAPLGVGRVIVATWQPQETAVLETIRELGLELQVIFNKGAVMVLPSGVNKASGMDAALAELRISRHNTVGIGDAENDHAFLARCECAVAVANALAPVKERADLITAGERGTGVIELIDRMLESDLADLEPRLERHLIPLGKDGQDEEVRLPPYGVNVLLAGTSGSGKSTFATGILERLAERHYQFCIIDPEGDYEGFQGAVVLGDGSRAPLVKEAIALLERPDRNAVVNLLALGLDERQAFFDELFAALLELRARSGKPHWIVIDETHHLLPAKWSRTPRTPAKQPHGLMLITVHPDQVAKDALSWVDLAVAIGKSPAETLATFAAALGESAPPVGAEPLATGEAVAWWRRPERVPVRFRSIPPHSERRRHLRKYAEGELGDSSFYFRGPEGKLNLRAQNLQLFLQMADGVDDDTWTWHLRNGDYSRWFREKIKDDALAEEAERIEQAPELSARESRAQMRRRVEERYTGAADHSS
jgi:hydroxymethylpyrimidine pyrophosphatase-like HAD family hydrolase